MSEPKHTPGPWVVDREVNEGDDGLFFVVMADDGAVTVAAPPTEADARLIAAAPDMLRALRSLFLPGSGAAMHAECWELVRAAVTKATTRAPS